MTPHSPAPWKLWSDEGDHFSICAVTPSEDRAGDHRRCIASVPYKGAPEEELANARVIAAAPELLESIKEIVSLTDRKTDIWDKAHAAIRKAEGGE